MNSFNYLKIFYISTFVWWILVASLIYSFIYHKTGCSIFLSGFCQVLNVFWRLYNLLRYFMQLQIGPLWCNKDQHWHLWQPTLTPTLAHTSCRFFIYSLENSPGFSEGTLYTNLQFITGPMQSQTDQHPHWRAHLRTLWEVTASVEFPRLPFSKSIKVCSGSASRLGSGERLLSVEWLTLVTALYRADMISTHYSSFH